MSYSKIKKDLLIYIVKLLDSYIEVSGNFKLNIVKKDILNSIKNKIKKNKEIDLKNLDILDIFHNMFIYNKEYIKSSYKGCFSKLFIVEILSELVNYIDNIDISPLSEEDKKKYVEEIAIYSLINQKNLIQEECNLKNIYDNKIFSELKIKKDISSFIKKFDNYCYLFNNENRKEINVYFLNNLTNVVMFYYSKIKDRLYKRKVEINREIDIEEEIISDIEIELKNLKLEQSIEKSNLKKERLKSKNKKVLLEKRQKILESKEGFLNKEISLIKEKIDSIFSNGFIDADKYNLKEDVTPYINIDDNSPFFNKNKTFLMFNIIVSKIDDLIPIHVRYKHDVDIFNNILNISNLDFCFYKVQEEKIDNGIFLKIIFNKKFLQIYEFIFIKKVCYLNDKIFNFTKGFYDSAKINNVLREKGLSIFYLEEGYLSQNDLEKDCELDITLSKDIKGQSEYVKKIIEDEINVIIFNNINDKKTKSVKNGENISLNLVNKIREKEMYLLIKEKEEKLDLRSVKKRKI